MYSRRESSQASCEISWTRRSDDECLLLIPGRIRRRYCRAAGSHTTGLHRVILKGTEKAGEEKSQELTYPEKNHTMWQYWTITVSSRMKLRKNETKWAQAGDWQPLMIKIRAVPQGFLRKTNCKGNIQVPNLELWIRIAYIGFWHIKGRPDGKGVLHASYRLGNYALTIGKTTGYDWTGRRQLSIYQVSN